MIDEARRWDDPAACDVPGCDRPPAAEARDDKGIVRFKFCAAHAGPLRHRGGA